MVNAVIDDNNDGNRDEKMGDDDEGSVKSKIKTKPANGCLNKHCIAGDCGGKLIKGNNWYVHNDRKHSTGVV